MRMPLSREVDDRRDLVFVSESNGPSEMTMLSSDRQEIATMNNS